MRGTFAFRRMPPYTTQPQLQIGQMQGANTGSTHTHTHTCPDPTKANKNKLTCTYHLSNSRTHSRRVPSWCAPKAWPWASRWPWISPTPFPCPPSRPSAFEPCPSSPPMRLQGARGPTPGTWNLHRGNIRDNTMSCGRPRNDK